MDDKELFINKHESAPLFEIEDFSCPPSSKSFYFYSEDGKKLRIALWNVNSSKGTILLQSGRTEFIEKYYEVIEAFISRGFCVALMDWRGQGLSERTNKNVRLGHIDSFKQYDRDLELTIEKIYVNLCPKPWIGFGHSMGGCLIISNLLKSIDTYDAIILSAPMLSMKVNRLVKFLTKMICSLFPGIKRFPIAKPTWDEEKGWKEEEFINNNLTSDKYRFERNYRLISKEPNLGVRGISIGWAYEAIKRTDQFKRVDWKNKIPKPTLLLSAKNDNLVDANINEILLSPIPNVSIVSINGKHELFMEEDHIREEAWRAVDVFLKNNFS